MSYDRHRLGFAAGVLAALALLAAMLALWLVSGVVPLLELVADAILLVLPGATFSAVLDALQRSAKPLLYLGVAVGTVIVGGFLGRWYAERPAWSRAAAIAVGAWLLFGVGLYWFAGAGVMGARLTAGPLWHGGTLLGLFALYGLVLHQAYAGLLRRAEAEANSELELQPESANGAGRRAVLRLAGGAAVATVVVGGVWRLLSQLGGPGGPGSSTSSSSEPPQPPAQGFEVKGLSPEVTSNADFYEVSKNFINPSVSSPGWRLTVDGLVDHPLSFTYEQLTALPAVENYYSLMCISNEVGGEYMGNARWRGVRLADLLGQAGVQQGAYKVVFSAADDYQDSVTLPNALQSDALLAWEMNGEPLPKEHGFPARLLIPGIYGMKNVKWLTGISLVKDDFKGYWQERGWDDDAPYQTAARIDVPSWRATLPAGPLDVAGVAFAGNRGIQKVEVSVDGGRSWQQADVKPALSGNAWQLWRATVEVDHSTRDVRARATDGLGALQTGATNPPFPSGSTGYHTVTIAVT